MTNEAESGIVSARKSSLWILIAVTFVTSSTLTVSCSQADTQTHINHTRAEWLDCEEQVSDETIAGYCVYAGDCHIGPILSINQLMETCNE